MEAVKSRREEQVRKNRSRWKNEGKGRVVPWLVERRRDLECFKSFRGGCKVQEERGASEEKELMEKNEGETVVVWLVEKRRGLECFKSFGAWRL